MKQHLILKKQFIEETAKECIEHGKFEKDKILKRAVLKVKSRDFRTFPDQLELEILDYIKQLLKEETKEQREQRMARAMLRKLNKENVEINKESARALYAAAGWVYTDNEGE